jgi:hypothetical protein
MKYCWIVTCFSFLAVSAAFAQQETTAQLPLKPVGENPTQTVSMKFIEGQANPGGPVQLAYIPDNVTALDSVSGVINKEVIEVVADPYSANKLQTTMTVRTAALLELHRMRKNAVDLCLQLPKKYRTHMPQCAAIFQHEIQLQTLAKDTK